MPRLVFTKCSLQRNPVPFPLDCGVRLHESLARAARSEFHAFGNRRAPKPCAGHRNANEEEHVKHVSSQERSRPYSLSRSPASLWLRPPRASITAPRRAAGIQVCGLMPDTKTSVRWEQFDQPSLIKGVQGRRRLRACRQRAGRPAEAEDAGRPVHRRRGEGPDHRPDRLRLRGCDREGRPRERRQVDRLRPPGRGWRRPSCTRRSTARPSACCRARASSAA